MVILLTPLSTDLVLSLFMGGLPKGNVKIFHFTLPRRKGAEASAGGESTDGR